MKKYILFFFFIMVLLPLVVFSQTAREDVVHMKNGSIYRGTIVEQIPGASYKIEIAGGSIIVIRAEEVTKITKEDKTGYTDDYLYDKPRPQYEFHYRDKGYFIEAQAMAEVAEMGLRAMGGYKFNQFGILALGTGIDGVICDLHGNFDYGGPYIPVYAYYSGEILRQHITPFYSVEAGYAFRPNTWGGNEIYNYGGSGPIGGHGGFMAGAAFGVRFYSRRRVHFDLSAHVDFKMTTENYETETNYNPNTGSYNDYFYSTSEVMIIPGLRFGFGF